MAEDQEGQEYGESINALEMLREDHRKMEELFEQVENADNRSLPRLAEEILTELEIHAKLEEGMIYPAIREELDEEERMDLALEEHHLVHVLVKELRKMGPKDERYRAKLKVLGEIVKHHIEEEESEILPQAQETDIDFEELGAKAMQRKEKLMGGDQQSKKGKASSARGNTRSRKRTAA